MFEDNNVGYRKFSLFAGIGKKLIFSSFIVVFLSVILSVNIYSFSLPFGYLYTIIFIVILAFAISFFMSIYVSQSIIIPIGKLYNATQEVEKGNFKVNVDIKTKDELQELGEVFNKTASALDKIDEEHKQIEKAKTEFLSITSHELRSPMTPMKAQLQMLLEGYFGKLNDKQRNAIDITLRNTNRLDKIIVDLLEISRIEAARLSFNFIDTDLNKEIQEFIQEMEGYMPDKKIKITLKMDKLPIVKIDPDRIMQVLRNLIENSKKFSGENSIINLEISLQKDSVLFSVSDEGVGISLENQKNIFSPFFQEEQTIYRKYGGVGLGLAICKGIVESQGGKIWFKSEKGKGSTFSFTVPLKPVEDIKPIKLVFMNGIKQF